MKCAVSGEPHWVLFDVCVVKCVVWPFYNEPNVYVEVSKRGFCALINYYEKRKLRYRPWTSVVILV